LKVTRNLKISGGEELRIKKRDRTVSERGKRQKGIWGWEVQHLNITDWRAEKQTDFKCKTKKTGDQPSESFWGNPPFEKAETAEKRCGGEEGNR